MDHASALIFLSEGKDTKICQPEKHGKLVTRFPEAVQRSWICEHIMNHDSWGKVLNYVTLNKEKLFIKGEHGEY